MENQDSKLLEILQQEKFLAFFDFAKSEKTETAKSTGSAKWRFRKTLTV